MITLGEETHRRSEGSINGKEVPWPEIPSGFEDWEPKKTRGAK